MRLTCYSYSDWLIRQDASGLPDVLLYFEQDTAESGQSEAVAGVLPFPGARSAAPRATYGLTLDHAPWESDASDFWSTNTSVDTAGWTEVVIQEGTHVLFHVFTGHGAEVNASVNHVMETALPAELMLRQSDAWWPDNRTCGCPGRSEVNDNKISCPML